LRHGLVALRRHARQPRRGVGLARSRVDQRLAESAQGFVAIGDLLPGALRLGRGQRAGTGKRPRVRTEPANQGTQIPRRDKLAAQLPKGCFQLRDALGLLFQAGPCRDALRAGIAPLAAGGKLGAQHIQLALQPKHDGVRRDLGHP
jgi:hypothetical protein